MSYFTIQYADAPNSNAPNSNAPNSNAPNSNAPNSNAPNSNAPIRIRMFLNWKNAETTQKDMEAEFNLFSVPGYKTTFDLVSGEDYTHAIIVNTSMPPLRIPKENVIGLAWEPNPFLNLTPQFIEYAKTYIGRYFIGQSNGLPPPFEEKYAFLNSNIFQTHIPPKTKRCSMIFSQKNYLEGHQYRNRLVEAILKTNLPVDIWGRGCNLIRGYNDPRIKGEFVQNSVLPYEDYAFHICIENIRLNHYFSEKIVNALYSECTPIYLGCKQIDDYFPGQIVHLNGDIDADIDLIRKCLENPAIYNKQINGQQIHKHMNPFFQIETLFK